MKRILSIDGGGIRGLVSALVLAEIESGLNGDRLAERFDLIAGTSSGGLLALCLVKPRPDKRPEFPATALPDLFRKEGRTKIFVRSWLKRITSLWGIVDEKYDDAGLNSVLSSYLGDVTLGSAACDVMITSYDMHDRAPRFFKSWRSEWAQLKMTDAARATAAAPTFFEPILLGVDSGAHGFIDGGLVSNNPAVCAYAECRSRFPGEDVLLVSIGAGSPATPISFQRAKGWGKAGWALNNIVDYFFDGAADAVDYQMRHFLGDSFIRLQQPLRKASDRIDDTSEANIEGLEYHAQDVITSQRNDIERICQML